MELATITLEQCLDIRHAVLWPQLERDASRVEGDEHASALWRAGAAAGRQLFIGILLGVDRHCQIRKFATVQDQQQRGFGGFCCARCSNG